jgi:hypothetical protein
MFVKLSLGLGGACVALLAWSFKMDVSAQTPPPPASEEREPVLVELFTSEGCSSCPPADALLAELDSRQPLPSAEVIAIEEHVDYWDQQGWKDPFSSSAWTFRQNEYSSFLHSGSSYTPEMVVDGTEGFVGSRGPTAKAAIEKAALAKKAKIEISEASPGQNRAAVLKVNIEKLANATPKDSAQVLLAITETGLHSAVKAGENAGHELRHSPVLRELKVIGVADKNGENGFAAQPAVKLDSAWNAANLRAVIFIQEKKSRRVLGVGELPLAPQAALR